MLFSTFVLALALAADAFAVSLSQGVALRRAPGAMALRLGVVFGAAQGLMPLLGWGLGLVLAQAIAAYDQWIAFAALAFLGANMIREGISRETGEGAREARGWTLAMLTLATSIDAAGAGLALSAMRVDPLLAAGTIALVTATLCALGVYIGRAVGARLGRYAECFGGVALIGVGLKMLIDHAAFG